VKDIVRTWVLVVAASISGVGASYVLAQEKANGGAPAAPSAAAETKAPPPIPDDAKGLYAQLQVKGAGLAEAMALLQKEMDSVNAERGRLVQRLIAAQPDFDLVPAGPLAVAYVQKKVDPNKDLPK
jgi:hypothetical protein